MDGRTDGWMDGYYGSVVGGDCMGRRMEGQTGGCMTDGRIDRWQEDSPTEKLTG